MKNTKIKNVLAVALESNGKSGAGEKIDMFESANILRPVQSIESMKVPTVTTPALSTAGTPPAPTGFTLADIDNILKNNYDPTKVSSANAANTAQAVMMESAKKGNFNFKMRNEKGELVPYESKFDNGVDTNIGKIDYAGTSDAYKNNMGFMDKYGAGITTGLSALNAGVGILAYKDSHRQLKDNLESAALNREAVRKDMQYTDEYRNAYKA